MTKLLKPIGAFIIPLLSIPLALWLAVETEISGLFIAVVLFGAVVVYGGFMGHRYEREFLEAHYMARLAYWRLRDPQRAKELERQRRFGPERYKDHWIR